MSSNIGEKAKESAALRAEKRATALRENLKRRKAQAAGTTRDEKRENNADSTDSE